MTLFHRVLLFFKCEHEWKFLDTVEDQDLRSGAKFWSDRFMCWKCNKVKTIEKREEIR